MFPELRSAARSFLARSGPQVQTLGDLSVATEHKDYSSDQGAAWYLQEGFFRTFQALGGGSSSASGERVTIEAALNHSVVWACNRIISETKGLLPCLMMQKSKNGDKREAEEHPMYRALRYEPNPDMVAMGFHETLTSHAVLRGNAFAQIARRSGTGVAMEMYPIHPDRVLVARDKKGQLVYEIRDGGGAGNPKTFTVERGKPQEIFHLRGIGDDGILGYSVIQKGRESIGTAMAAERNVANFYRHGGRVAYNLKIDPDFKNETDKDRFRADWEQIANQPSRVPILPKNITYTPVGVNLKDAQLLETRAFGVSEICRWFSVSPHMVADLSRATNNNIEQLAQEFINFTMATWITRWDQELMRCVLTPEEKSQGYFWYHDTSVLLRGDFATRMSGYATGLQNAWISPDEVRAREGLNPIPDGAGKAYHIQYNMATLPGTGEAMPPPPAKQPRQAEVA